MALVLSGDFTLDVVEGLQVTLGPADFLASDDAGTLASGFTYSVTPPGNGFFALSGAPTVPVTTFTQEDIDSGLVIFVHDGSEASSDTFSISVANGIDPDASPATTPSVAVTNTNDAPTFTSPAAVTVDENQAVSLFVAATDPDGPGAITYSISGGADELQFGIIPLTGQIFGGIYDAEAPVDANGDGVFELEITANDGTDTTVQTLLITIASVNEAPVAVGDASSTNEDIAVIISPLANDTDVDVGDVSSIASFTQPSNGVVTDNGDGTLTYTPDADYNGNDSFTYTVSDVDGLTDTATVNLTVNAVNDAPATVADSDVTDEDVAVTIDVLVNDTDVDDTIDASSVLIDDADGGGAGTTKTVAGEGVWTVNGTNGEITFTPEADYDGPVTDITYTVADVAGDRSDPAAVSVTLNSVNDAPVFTSAAAFNLDENTVAVGTISATDVDPDTLTFSITGGADAALFSVDANSGALTFDTAPNFEAAADVGTDNDYDVIVTVADGTTTTDQAVVITVDDVNDAPVANVDSDTTDEEAAVTIDVLANDTDEDGTPDPLTVEIVGADGGSAGKTKTVTGEGVWTVNATTGAITFTPEQDFEGPVTDIQYTVLDDDGLVSDPAVVSVSLSQINDDPIANDDSAVTDEDNAVEVDVVANDTDVDGTPDPLTVEIVGADGGSAGKTKTVTGEGVWTVNATTGAITFTPEQDFEGPVTDIQYTIADDDGAVSAPATVSVDLTNINDAPVITSANAFNLDENTTAVDTITATDVDAGTVFTYSISGGADAAFFTIDSSTGALSFIAAPDVETPLDVNGDNAYEVIVAVSDGTATTTMPVTVTVDNVNEAPVQGGDLTAFGIEGSSILITQGDLAATDPESAPSGLTYTVTAPVNGYVALTSSVGSPITSFTQADVDANSVVFVHDGSETTAASFDVIVTDEGSLTAGPAQTVNLTIANVNQPPTITSGAAFAVDENDTAVLGTVTATDPDPGTTLTFSINTAFNGGTDALPFQINSATGELSAISGVNFEALEDLNDDNVFDLEVEVSDGALTVSQQIAITVSDVGESPDVSGALAGTIAEGGQLGIGAAILGATDPESGPADITFTISNLVNGHVALVSAPATPITSFTQATLAAGDIVFVHDGTETATASFDVSVDDTDAGTPPTPATVTFTVGASNDAPLTVADTATTDEDTAVTISVLANDSDSDGLIDATTVQIAGADGGSNGRTKTVAGEGVWTVNATNGDITFTPEADYDGPVTDITYTVRDDVGAESVPTAVSVTLTPVSDAPTITSGGAFNVDENDTASFGTVTATDIDDVSFTFALDGTHNGGTDAAPFQVNSTTGELSAINGVDFEALEDDNDDNVFEVKVDVSDGVNTVSQIVQITVNPVSEAPTANDDSAVGDQDVAITLDILANDSDPETSVDSATIELDSADGGTNGKTRTITGEGVWQVNDGAGNVTFTPDTGYVGTATPITYTVADTDGNRSDPATISLDVVVPNQLPVITSTGSLFTIEENTTEVTTITATDPDGGTITFTVAGGVDAALFTINPTTGELAFATGPDFEVPTDNNANNLYEVVVGVSDGEDTVFRALAINVTNVQEFTGSIGQWLFDNAVTPGEDTSGNDNNAFFVGGANPVGNVVNLDGNNDFIEIDDIGAYQLPEGSVRITFTIDDLDGTNSGNSVTDPSFHGLFSRDSSGFDGGGHVTALVDGDGSVFVRHQTQQNYELRTDAGVVTAGEEITLIYSFDAENGMSVLVEDESGSLTLVGSNSSPVANNDPVTLQGNTEPWTVGASQVSSGDNTSANPTSFLDGQINKFEVFGEPVDLTGVSNPGEFYSLSGFQDELVLDRGAMNGNSGFFLPISMAFLPDNRMLLVSKDGEILIVDPETGANSVYMTLNNIDSGLERGALDIVLDPDFDTNGHFYLYYTPNSPQNAQIARFTHQENSGGLTSTGDLSSEFTVWQDTDGYLACCHYGGGLDFGPDGKLWLTTSDKFQASTPGEGDTGGSDLPINLASTSGKVIRVNKDGTVPDGTDGELANPFTAPGDGINDYIFAYGLRNPFRAEWDLENELFYIGEVGGNQQTIAEEDVHVISLDQAGAFLGWPFYEGTENTYVNANQSGFNLNNFPDADTDLADAAAGDFYSAPIFSVPHDGLLFDGTLSSSITGGEVYRGDMFPDEWDGVYFYGDYTRDYIRYLVLDETGTEVLGDYAFKPSASIPGNTNEIVNITVGNDGALYYTLISSGEIRRVTFAGNDAPDIVSATLTPQVGDPPFDVTFTATVTDPEGDPMSYILNFGDGTIEAGAVAANGIISFNHTYVTDGLYDVSLSVSDGARTSLSESFTATVGDVNTPPEISAASSDVTQAEPTETVTFTGNASDIDGDNLTYTWDFGDGTSEAGTVPANGIIVATHAYTVDGDYNAVLQVSDGEDVAFSNFVPVVIGEISDVPVTDGLSLLLESDIKIGLDIDGTTVLSWLDGSGNGNNLFAEGDPQLVPNATPTGEQAIVFDGVEDLLERVDASDTITGMPTGNQERTMFFVVDYLEPNNVFSGASFGDGDTNQAFGLITDTDGDLGVQAFGVNDQDSNVDGQTPGYLVQSVVVDNGTVTQYLDGTVISTAAVTYATDVKKIVLAGEISGLGESAMSIASVIIYDRALTEVERQLVEEFLQTKYIVGPPTLIPTNDTASTFEDTPTNIDVLANDVDTDNDPITIVAVSDPDNGTATINDGGTPGDPSDDTIDYTPDAGFGGIETFTYDVTDGNGETVSATVTVTVADPVTAVDDLTSVADIGIASIDVLSNDIDLDGDPLELVSFTQGAQGTVTRDDNGTPGDTTDDTLVYTPNGTFAGTDTFTYDITDGTNSDTGTVTVDVIDSSVPPVTSGLVAVFQSDQNITTAGGNTVAGWLDGSGNGNDLVASGDPQIVENGTPRGQPAISFDGTGDLLERLQATDGLNALPSGNDPRTLIFVVNYLDPEGVFAGFAYGEDALNQAFGLVASDTGDLTVQGFGNDFATTVDGVAPGWLIHSVVLDGNQLDHYLNGTLIGAETADFATDLERLVIGGEIGGAGEASMDVAAALIYNRALDMTELTDVVNYLDDKFIQPNTAPVAEDESFTDDVNVPISGNVLVDNGNGADSDADGDALTVNTTPVVDVANGTLVLNSDGSFTYTPDTGFIGTDSFTYEVDDGFGGTDTAEVSLVVFDPTNTVPDASDDTATGNEDTSIQISVLSNDTDPDTDDLEITAVAGASNGTTSINDNGTPGDTNDDLIVYTPDSDFSGTDSFTYTITDGRGGVDTATVNVTVDPVNDAPNAEADIVTTAFETVLNGNVLADNGFGADSDVEGDTLTVGLGDDVDNGTLVLNGDGTFTYTPDAGYEGPDSFTYTIDDGNGGTDTASVSITVEPDFPTPVYDAPGIMTFNGTNGSVLEIPHDPAFAISEGAIAFSFIPDDTNGAQGLFTKDAGGFSGGGNHTLIYLDGTTLKGRFQNGVDSITLEVPGIAAGVNHELVANFSAAGVELWLGGVMVASDPIVMDWTTNVEYIQWGGRGWSSATGAPGFDAPFDGTISDKQIYAQPLSPEQVGELAARASGFNVDPVAADDGFSTTLNAGVSGNVLIDNGNGVDSDADGDALSVNTTPVVDVANGTLVLNGDGSFTYTPDTGFIGTDSFTYELDDGFGGTDTAVATINVTDPSNIAPDAQDDAVTVAEDSGVTVVAVLADNGNGVDSDANGDPLTISGITQGANGSVTDNGDGTVSYTPDANFSGTDSFTYTITDGRNAFDTATVTVTVTPENDDPVAVNDIVTTGFETAIAGDVTSNDVDPDGDTLTVGLGDDVDNGTLVLNGDGTFTYTPDAGYEGPDSFTYTIDDGNGGTDTASVSITVEPDFPTPVYDAPGIMTFNGTNGSVLEIPHDPAFAISEGAIAFSFIPDDTNGAQGLFTKDAGGFSGGGNHTLIYLDGTTLKGRFQNGVDSITLEVPGIAAGVNHELVANFSAAGVELWLGGVMVASDPIVMDWTTNVEYIQWGGRGWSSATGAPGFDAPFDGTISDKQIYAQPLSPEQVGELAARASGFNVDPVAADDGFSTTLNAGVSGNVLIDNGNGVDSDADGDALSVNTTPVVDVANGTLVLNGDGSFTYTPDTGFIGTDSFTYELDDGFGGTDTAVATINVTDPSNIAPDAQDDAVTVAEDSGVTVVAVLADNGNGVDSDANGDPLTISGITQGANGSVTDNGDGTVSYTPDANFSGTDSFTYTITDGRNAFDTATVTVTVTPENDDPVAVNDIVTTGFETAIAGDVTSNDVDPDGDTLTVGLGDDVDNGTLVLNGDGTFTYTPDAGYEGPDSFTYTIDDGNGGTDTASVSITVEPDFPTPVYDAPGIMTFNGTNGSVLEIPHDPAFAISEGAIAFSFIPDDTNGAQGLFTKDAGGFSGGGNHTLIYLDGTTLKGRFQNGVDSITLEVPGIAAGVNHELVANFSAAGVELWLGGVMVASDPIVMDWTTNVEYIQWGGRGWSSATGAPGFDAPFDGTISDKQIYAQPLSPEQVGELAARASGFNVDPVAADDGFSTTLNAGVSGNVLIDNGNGVDSDADGDALSVNTTPVVDVANGTLVLNGDGSFTYTPDTGFIGTDSFTYELDDGFGGTDTAVATINVTDPSNIAPDAQDDAVTVAEDSGVTVVAVLADNGNGVDSDANGDPLTISGITQGANGSVTDNGDGTVSYTPDANFSGTDSFTYTITDGRNAFDTATVTVTVTPENDDPVAVNDIVTTGFETAIAGDVTSNDVDPDGDTLTVGLGDDVDNGTLVLNGDGTFTYTPDAGYEGPDSFTYTIDDGNGGTDTASVSITVESSAPTPIFTVGSGVTTFGGGTGDVINLVHDTDLEIPEGTIAFSFKDFNTGVRQGLFTKDANGFEGGGNHFVSYIDGGDLIVRFQNGVAQDQFIFENLNNGQEYEFAATFGASGVALWIDGVEVFSDPGFAMSWETNVEHLQVGGLGWSSASGSGTFSNPFSGEVADVEIYDEILDAAEINALATQSSFDL